MRPPRMPTSRTPSPSWLTTVAPLSTRSKVSAIAPLAACLRLAARIRKTDAGCNRSGEMMAETRIALLPDRGVVSVTGADAEKLLQGVITNDMELLGATARSMPRCSRPRARSCSTSSSCAPPTASCSRPRATRPRTWPSGSCCTSCAPRPTSGTLLRLYRRRDLGRTVRAARHRQGTALVRRSAVAGARLRASSSPSAPTGRSANEDADSATQDDYHAHRIALGVPEGGKDYAFGDTFPHEALFDQLERRLLRRRAATSARRS